MKMTIGKKLTGQSEPQRNFTRDETRIGFETVTDPLLNMTEIRSKRGQRSKYFSDGQNKMTAEFYDSPVHYYDENEKGFVEIDNRLRDHGETLETRSGAFKSRFNKRANDGKIFEMEQNLCKVGLKSLDAAKCGTCNLEVCECEDGAGDGNKVLMKNVTENTDIEYIVESERIKENIIVREKADKYEYDFDLSLDNLSVDVAEDGKSLELKKKDSGRVQFCIPAPVMFDAAGNSSDSAYYEVEQNHSDSVSIKVVADAEWMNDGSRVFPVVIDPQIVTKEYVGEYYDEAGYENSLFEYTQLHQSDRCGGEPRLYYDRSSGTEISTEITIHKRMLPGYLQNNFKKVTLKLIAKPGSVVRGFSIGYSGYDSFSLSQPEYLADITSYFYEDRDDVIIFLYNHTYRRPSSENDITFYPPVLLIEFENHIKRLVVTQAPNKTSYIPGEVFDPTGMVVAGIYENASSAPLPYGDLTFYPSGAFATYDTGVRITHKIDSNVELEYKGITIAGGKYWLDDRRPEGSKENVYTLTPVNANGEPSGVTSTTVRIELNDGVDVGSPGEGTPLNAETFNVIIKELKNKGILD